MPGSERAHRGFTLIELLVTVSIVALLATLATASYRQYLRRANRVDATATLLRIASAQEKFYLQNGEYADAGVLADAPPAGLGIAGTEHGHYLLDITLPAGGAVVGYAATALVDENGAQSDDTECWAFAIDERGVRTAWTREGDTSETVTASCWR